MAAAKAIDVLMEMTRELFPSEDGVPVKYKRFIAAAHGRALKKPDKAQSAAAAGVEEE